MASLKITLDKRKKNQFDTYPIIFRISLKGKSRDSSTGIFVKESDWLSKSSSVSKTNPNNVVLNNQIRQLEQKYLSKMFEFEKLFPDNNSVNELKDFITDKKKVVETVQDFWKHEIELLYKAQRNGGALVYEESLRAITKYRSLQISFDTINYRYLQELEADFISNGYGVNSIGIYYRTLRAVFNKAIHAGVTNNNNYPFKAYRIKKERRVPRTITLKELQNYFSLDVPENSPLYDHWLIGKLMFMLMGINFTDLISLNDENIHGDRINYTRSKTKKLYNIQLHPEALRILDLFRIRGHENVFGIITSTSITNSSRKPIIIRQKNRIYNNYLEQLGETIGCKEKLTGYVFRYTWANIAKSMGYSKDMIAEGLGHNYGSDVTGIYLNDFDKELIDEMNFKIINRVLLNEKG